MRITESPCIVRRRFTLFVPLLLVLLTTACLDGPNFTRGPDEVLFDRGNEALSRERFDIAGLELVTLVNTYPQSNFAGRATTMLENDPRLSCIATNNMNFGVGSTCNDGNH